MRDEAIDTVSTALGESFEIAYTEGRALALQDAVGEALVSID
jgi:hypothetical protein